MHEARTASEVASQLRDCHPNALGGLIGIDGTDGVGKTTLAIQIGEIIGGTIISLDDFVVKNRGGYVPHLRQSELRNALAAARRPIVVEGVCLLAALEVVSVGVDVLIYVKRVSDYGFWHDEAICDPEEGEDELIQRLSQEAAAFAELDAKLLGGPEPSEGEGQAGLTRLREEIIRYHCRFRPSRHAHILFIR